MSDTPTPGTPPAVHTPGPWQAGRPDMKTAVDGVLSKWIYADDQYVAVASGRIAGDWDEVMANARLIAAAPAMLAALGDLVAVAEMMPGFDVGDPDAFAVLELAKDAARMARGLPSGIFPEPAS